MRKLVLLLVAIVAVSTAVSAQTVKFGRVNSAEIIELMPETDTIKVLIEARQKQLTEQITYMQQELQRKIAAFEKDSPSLSGVILEQRRNDIIDLQTKLESFGREAQNELMQYQSELTAPIFEKVQNAIDKIAKLNGMTFVLDESSQVPSFVYVDKDKVKDITAQVKAELKIK